MILKKSWGQGPPGSATRHPLIGNYPPAHVIEIMTQVQGETSDIDMNINHCKHSCRSRSLFVSARPSHVRSQGVGCMGSRPETQKIKAPLPNIRFGIFQQRRHDYESPFVRQTRFYTGLSPHQTRIGIRPELSKRIAIEMYVCTAVRSIRDEFKYMSPV